MSSLNVGVAPHQKAYGDSISRDLDDLAPSQLVLTWSSGHPLSTWSCALVQIGLSKYPSYSTLVSDSKSVFLPSPLHIYAHPNERNDAHRGSQTVTPSPTRTSSFGHRGLACPHHGFFASCGFEQSSPHEQH